MIVNYCILSSTNDIIPTNTVNWDGKTLNWDGKTLNWDGFRKIFKKLIKQVKTDDCQL